MILFSCEHIFGNKTRNVSRGRFIGGISFYYRNEQFIKAVQKDQCGKMWVKISARLFPFDQDAFICYIYVPPTNPKCLQTSNNDLYEQLETELIKYNELQ